MCNTKNNFIQRFISVFLFTPIVLLALMWSPWTYFLLFFYVVMLAMLEFYKLIRQAQVTPMRIQGIVLGLVSYTMTFAYCVQEALPPLLGYLVVCLILFVYINALYRRKFSNPFLDIAATFLGVLYIAIPCSMLHYLAFFSGKYSYKPILGLLLIAWSQDVGAYLVGSLIGKYKIFKRISPNKTWEGAIGGAAAALMMGYKLTHFLPTTFAGQWLPIAIITIFTGTYGDLVASLLKRSVAAKHTGNLIPGHGGLLDRVDSLLLTIPSVVAFLRINALWNI